MLVIVLAGGAATTAMLLLRQRAPEGGWFRDTTRAAAVFNVLAGAWSVMLAFVAFIALDHYSDAENQSSIEAFSVGTQHETAELLPSATLELRAVLICYGRAVVYREWPAMRRGERSPTVDHWVDSLKKRMESVPVDDDREEVGFDEWFDATIDRDAARRSRLNGAEGVLPTPMWFILLLGALLVVAYPLLFSDRGERPIPQSALMASITVLVVALLLVVDFLDHPFSEEAGGIRPTDMASTVERMVSARPEGGSAPRLPCDDSGLPHAS